MSCTENIDETPSGMLMHGIMSSIAEFYSRKLAHEVIKGSVQKAKAGGTIGRAPIGYLNVRRYENGLVARTIEVDPERAPLVRWAFEAYATGEWTLRGLLEELHEERLTNRATTNQLERPLHLSHLASMLKHPYYLGLVRYRGVIYEDRHERLVDR